MRASALSKASLPMPWVFCVIVAFRRAALDRFETRDVAIKADDDHLVTKVRHFGGLSSPQGQGVRTTKEDRDIRISLEHVLPDGETFVLHPRVARLLGHNLQIRELRKGFVEAFVPILFRRRAELTLDNGDLAFSAGNLADVFAEGPRRTDTVRGDEGVARSVRSIAINGNDGNLRILRCLDGHSGRGGACRNVDERIHSSRNQVLDLANLSGGIALRVDRDDLDALGFGLTFDRLLDLIEEVGLEIGNCQADGYSCWFSFSSASAVDKELAQIPTAAAAVTMSLSLGRRFLVMVCIWLLGFVWFDFLIAKFESHLCRGGISHACEACLRRPPVR